MRIAYVSYEFPPDIIGGGIATYTLLAAKTLKSLGHDVEVFAGSHYRNISEKYEDMLVHRIKIDDVSEFRIKIVEVFKLHHYSKHFDVFESAEINANGIEIKRQIPELPLLLRLHMPVVLQLRLQNYHQSFFTRARFTISNLIKKRKLDLGNWSKFDKNQFNDQDYLITEFAQLIIAPSQAMKTWAINFWRIDENRIKVVPYPFIPSIKHIEIPIECNTNRILFFGRLNVHKGMVTYTKVIPKVLRKFPYIKFRIIGADSNSHKKNVSMKQFMESKLSKFLKNIEFIDFMPYELLPDYIADSDICVFPSIWECFGLVVCDAMTAGRAVIVSKNGGMSEIVEDNITGLVADPLDSEEIANKIIYLIQHPELRFKMAATGRESILVKYNAQKIGKLMEDFYCQTINIINNEYHR